MKEKLVKCPSCGGDGKDTCNNPDHGFYSMVGGIVSANESACPCCGHDENHKIYKWKDGKRYQPNCEVCLGKGQMRLTEAVDWVDENGYDNELTEL